MKEEKKNRINDDLKYEHQIRLVGDNVENGVYSYYDAIKLADDMNLDLVEVSKDAKPVVCKVMDYKKYLYQQKKKAKEQAANSKQQETKEIRFTPQTGENDYAFKLNHAKEFLKDGNKVKASVFFKGREIAYKDKGELLLAQFCTDLEEFGTPEKVPALEGKRMFVTIKPKKK